MRAVFWRSRNAVSAWQRRRRDAAWDAADAAAWLAEASRRRWVFVVGCTRSGKSTVVDLLQSHPDVTVIPRADLKTAALVHPRAHGIERVWTEKLELFRLTEASSREPASRLIFDWMTAQRVVRPVVVIDSNLPAVQMRWLQEVFRDSHFIAVVRNGLAVAAAMREKSGHAIDRCARHWSVVNATMLADAPSIRNLQWIWYEDLVSNPGQVATTIAERTGLGLAALRRALESGWRPGNLRGRPEPLANDNPRLMGQLSPAEVDTIRACAGDMLARLGYLPVPATQRSGAANER